MIRATYRWMLVVGCSAITCWPLSDARGGEGGARTYVNKLVPIADPKPILADHPEFVAPITETARFEAPALVDEPNADLSVRAWRFSYNARGIVEVPNRLRAEHTAIIVVHPWGIDDGQGWDSPDPAGVAFQCTPAKNAIVNKHMATVIDPFLKKYRGKVKLIAYSLRGAEDPIRAKMYRSYRNQPSPEDRLAGQKELAKALADFEYRGEPLPARFSVGTETPVVEYFKQFSGLDPGAKFNNNGFWDLPVPVNKNLQVDLEDLVIYDSEGYAPLRDYLKSQGVRHVLLTGYNTDMCICSTTAGYENLSKDFDVFLVGDATIATFPANPSPRYATNAAVSFAALRLFITQTGWVKHTSQSGPRRATALE